MTGLSRKECHEVVFGISSLISSHSTSKLPHVSYNNIEFRCLVRALTVVTLDLLIIGAPIPETEGSIPASDELVLGILAPLIQANASSPV